LFPSFHKLVKKLEIENPGYINQFRISEIKMVITFLSMDEVVLIERFAFSN
jgi:hypothetical protein